MRLTQHGPSSTSSTAKHAVTTAVGSINSSGGAKGQLSLQVSALYPFWQFRQHLLLCNIVVGVVLWMVEMLLAQVVGYSLKALAIDSFDWFPAEINSTVEL